MGQYSTPITGRLLALVFRSVSEEQEVSVRKLFSDFRSANDVLYWNLNLSEAVQACRLVGHLQPHTLLIEGFSADLNDIIEAWCKRLLKFPPGFIIENVGELRGLQFVTVPQVVSIPLDDALCYIIYDLNCTERASTFEVVCSTLSRWYGGLQMPPLGLVHSALQRLMRASLIYHTGYGYSILTSEKAHVVRWLTQLPADLHDSPSSCPPSSFQALPQCYPPATSPVPMLVSSCLYRPPLSPSEACTGGGGCSVGGAFGGGRMTPASDRNGAGQLESGQEEASKSRGSNKSFLSRLFSRMKPRKATGSPTGCLPLYSHDNPPPSLTYPQSTTPLPPGSYSPPLPPPPPPMTHHYYQYQQHQQMLLPHGRMCSSAWSPVCQGGSRDSPISSDNIVNSNNYNSELVTTYSEGLLSDPSHLITLDYRRQRGGGPGSRRPLVATAATHLRHSFAMGDSPAVVGGGIGDGSPEGGDSVEHQHEAVWGRGQTSAGSHLHHQAEARGGAVVMTTTTSEGGPLLSPPSTHDSGFNSSRTLLDLETSEQGGSGGTGASSFNVGLSKAEMLKRRMESAGSLD